MTISVAVTPVRKIVTAQTEHADVADRLVYGNSIAHDTAAFLWLDRTGGAVLNEVTDNAGGTLTGGQWVARSVSGTSHVIYVREDLPAQTGFLAYLTTNASQNSQVVGVLLRSDAGGVVYPTFDQVATVATGTSVTIATSNTLTISAAGITLGLMSFQNSQSTTPTDNGSGATINPGGGAGVRLFATYRNEVAGPVAAHSFTVATTNFAYHLISFIESGATPPSLILMGQVLM